MQTDVFPSSVYSGLCIVIPALSPYVSVQEDDGSPALYCHFVTEHNIPFANNWEKNTIR